MLFWERDSNPERSTKKLQRIVEMTHGSWDEAVSPDLLVQFPGLGRGLQHTFKLIEPIGVRPLRHYGFILTHNGTTPYPWYDGT